MRFLSCVVFVLAGSLVLSGCGGPEMAPVKGRVTFKGKPVKDAAVTFSPSAKSSEDKFPGKPAVGFTDEEGNYELSTFKPREAIALCEDWVNALCSGTFPRLRLPAKQRRSRPGSRRRKPGS